MGRLSEKANAAWVRYDAENGNEQANIKLCARLLSQAGSLGKTLLRGASQEFNLLNLKTFEIEEASARGEAAEKLRDYDCANSVRYTLHYIKASLKDDDNIAMALWRVSNANKILAGNATELYFLADRFLTADKLQPQYRTIERAPPYVMNYREASDYVVEWLTDAGKACPESREKIEQLLAYDTVASQSKRLLKKIGLGSFIPQ